MPKCGGFWGFGFSCCSYQPKGMDSLRAMLEYCGGYTSVYWKSVGGGGGGGGGNDGDDQVAEYGIRVDFDIVISSKCLRCQDVMKGGGSCGFDVHTLEFLCICDDRNVTSFCQGNSFFF